MIPALSAELCPAWLLRGPLGAAGARLAIHQLHRHADDAFMLKQPFLQPHQSPGFLSRKISTLEFVVFLVGCEFSHLFFCLPVASAGQEVCSSVVSEESREDMDA